MVFKNSGGVEREGASLQIHDTGGVEREGTVIQILFRFKENRSKWFRLQNMKRVDDPQPVPLPPWEWGKPK